MKVDRHDTSESLAEYPALFTGGLQEMVAVSISAVLHPLGINLATVNKIVSDADLTK